MMATRVPSHPWALLQAEGCSRRELPGERGRRAAAVTQRVGRIRRPPAATCQTRSCSDEHHDGPTAKQATSHGEAAHGTMYRQPLSGQASLSATQQVQSRGERPFGSRKPAATLAVSSSPRPVAEWHGVVRFKLSWHHSALKI